METLIIINEILTLTLGPFGPMLMLLALLLFFGLLIVWGKSQEKNDPLSKLERKAKTLSWAQNQNPSNLLRQRSNNQALEKYSAFLEPTDQEELSQISKTLGAAGYRGADAVRMFYVAQLGLGLGFLALGLMYYLFQVPAEKAGAQSMLMYVVLPGAAGYILPKYGVNKRAASRRQNIQDGFPDSLDMMLICVEAGQILDQAIVRISGELRHSCIPLSEEFLIIAHELKAGKERPQVLMDFASRVDLQEITSFVTVMIESSQFGTSIAEALNLYAKEMREKRIMRAEEKANKLPNKMSLSTMGLTVPPLLIIMVGPSLLAVADMLSKGF